MSSCRKGLLSVNYRRQTLYFCLDSTVAIVVQILFNEIMLEVFYGVELLQKTVHFLAFQRSSQLQHYSGSFTCGSCFVGYPSPATSADTVCAGTASLGQNGE